MKLVCPLQWTVCWLKNKYTPTNQRLHSWHACRTFLIVILFKMYFSIGIPRKIVDRSPFNDGDYRISNLQCMIQTKNCLPIIQQPKPLLLKQLTRHIQKQRWKNELHATVSTRTNSRLALTAILFIAAVSTVNKTIAVVDPRNTFTITTTFKLTTAASYNQHSRIIQLQV